jgi:hypothetical protein
VRLPKGVEVAGVNLESRRDPFALLTVLADVSLLELDLGGVAEL